MRIGKVLGTVTLSHCHPTMAGARYVVAVPMSLAHLKGERHDLPEDFVVYDELGASPGSLIAISEGAEAAQPFRPRMKPIDAYNAAILDQINLLP